MDDHTRTQHTIEEWAEELGHLVESCEDWHTILSVVIPGLYGERPTSTKTEVSYTDGSRLRLYRYGRRAWQGLSVFNAGDGDGSTQEAQDAQGTTAAQIKATKGQGRTTEQHTPRLLRELAEATRHALGVRATVQDVQDDGEADPWE